MTRAVAVFIAVVSAALSIVAAYYNLAVDHDYVTGAWAMLTAAHAVAIVYLNYQVQRFRRSQAEWRRLAINTQQRVKRLHRQSESYGNA